MSVWTWIKRTATETGAELEAIPVGLERNPDAIVELGAENPPDVHLYLFRVGMKSGFGRQEATLPVFRRVNPSPHPILKEIYFCEVAGKTLEAANVFALRAKVQQALDAIAPGRTLPLCYFRAARYDYSLPVYEERAHLVCPVLTGPKLKGNDPGELLSPVCRWLRTAGYLMEDEDPEVEVVRPSDLRLVPPAAVIRCLDEPDLWMPTVEGTSPGGPVIGLLVQPAHLQVSERRPVEADQPTPASATDVTGLLRHIGTELARRGRLTNPWSVYATAVRPEIWARTEEVTDPTGRRLHCHMEGVGELALQIRHTAAGEVVAALEEDGISVFLAGDEDALGLSVGRYLADAGFLRRPDEVRTEAVTQVRLEALDPDAIWTGGGRDAAADTFDNEQRSTDQEVASP